VGLEPIGLLDGNCAVGCGPGINLLCWTVTVLWSFGEEWIGCVGR
jgi:hypothetical protein